MQTTQSTAVPPNYLLYRALPHQANIVSPVIVTPGPGTEQPGTASMVQSLLKLFNLANPISAYPVLLCLSHGNDNKGCWPKLSHFLLPPDQSILPCVTSRLLFLETCEYKLLPSWKLFSFLHLLLDLIKTNARYILKQSTIN